MIGKRIQGALNEQIKEELGSAYLYLSMATYFHGEGLHGMAHWMRVQAVEEEAHAMKIFDHMVERDGRVELKALSEPKREWDSPLVAFEAAYAHEQFVTGKIDELVKLAAEEADEQANRMLQWFVSEQVEEEESTSKVVQMIEQTGPSVLKMVDEELSQRK